MPEIKWNAELYDDKHGFVSKYGEDLVGWLAPQQGERILDLGCGTGQLSAEIAAFGAEVTGMDFSPEMIEKARTAYPGLHFDVRDARNFHYDVPFDGLFSNATLHWIREQKPAIACMHAALKEGGRLVVELGGKGNVEGIVQAVKAAVREAGKDVRDEAGWFFPSVGEYSAMLEEGGFDVRTALLFDRETVLSGADGMKNWIEMFAGFFFRDMEPGLKEEIIARAVEKLRPSHFREGSWYADYVRLRIKAIKKFSR